VGIVGGAAAPLRAQGSFGIAAGLYQPDDDDLDREGVFGLRGGYRFHNDFGLEGSLSRVELVNGVPGGSQIPGVGVDLEVNLYNLDLSLQWFPRGSLIVFGGPGVARLDSDVQVNFLGQRFSESDTSTIFTAHVGVAYEWQLSDRFFLRPEARVRRYFDDDLDEGDSEEGLAVSYKATDYEASVVFGWRLGG
jgi:hypothetical protein